MSSRPHDPDDDGDDDALRWAGDEARGQAAPRLRGEDAVPSVADGVTGTAAAGASAAVRTRTDTALLVTTGVFAGLYLATAVGWVLSAQLLSSPYLDLAGEIGWQFSEFLAMIAAVLWFGAVWVLTPAGTPWRAAKRVGWLLLGLVLLVPWPVLLGALG